MYFHLLPELCCATTTCNSVCTSTAVDLSSVIRRVKMTQYPTDPEALDILPKSVQYKIDPSDYVAVRVFAREHRVGASSGDVSGPTTSSAARSDASDDEEGKGHPKPSPLPSATVRPTKSVRLSLDPKVSQSGFVVQEYYTRSGRCAKRIVQVK